MSLIDSSPSPSCSFLSNPNRNDDNAALPPFHSLAFSAYYRTECQDKYCTSRLAYHVVNDNICASSLLLTPCFDDDREQEGCSEQPQHDHERQSQHTNSLYKPSYRCQAFVHGHQYSRKVRCFDRWVDAAGFVNAALSDIGRQMEALKQEQPVNEHDQELRMGHESIPTGSIQHASKA